MPDLGELLLFATLAGVAALVVAWPLLGGRDAGDPVADDEATPELRHRIALEALRDVEVDRRAGSLDADSHAEQRAVAEARAAQTLRQLEAAGGADRTGPAAAASGPDPAARRMLAALGAALALLLVVGLAVPAPVGLANETRVDEALAASRAAEEARASRIEALEARILADPADTAALSELADAYLAGSERRDLQRGAAALLLLVSLEPEDESAYQRLVTSYLRAGDYANAAAATDALAELAPDSTEVAFFRGLIALRGDGDAAAAIVEFDRFLELAPDDPRAGMVRELRREAAGE